MQDMALAFRVFVIGICSVFLVMMLLMLVLQSFGAIVRLLEKKRVAANRRQQSA